VCGRLILAILLVLTTVGAHAQDDSGITANLTLTSDYVFRGISQSGGDAALQSGVYYSHRSGLAAGLWASTLDPGADEVDTEIDYLLEYTHAFGEHWAASVGVTQYTYPGMSVEPDPDYRELLLSGYYDDWLSATVGYSDDVFGAGRKGVSYEINSRFAAPKSLEVSVGLGLYDLSEAYASKYSFYTLGLSRRFGILTVGLAYHGTGGDAVELFGAELTGGRSQIYLSADF